MTDIENLSINEKKILEARSYQLELLEYVCKKNAIIYLPTGSGKTYVAILALRRFSNQLIRTISEGGKRAVFMCNTIELARQQALGVRQQTNLKVGLYVGERGVDSWTPSRWKEEIDEHQVLVGTAQTFVNIVQGNYIKISDFNIVIIDECHNGTKCHPMHEFMKAFQYVEPEKQPRVIGLTGVLMKGNKLSNIMVEVKALEATFLGNILTVRSTEAFENVMIYSTKPKESLIAYDSSAGDNAMIERLVLSKVESICNDVEKWDLGVIPPRFTRGMAGEREPNKKSYIKNLLKDFFYQVQDLGVYPASYAILNCIVDFEIKKRQSETMALRQLYRHMITSCEFIRHLLLRDMESKTKDINSQEGILTFCKPKLRTLLLLITNKFSGREFKEICSLVFVERRSSAKCLYNVIQQWINVVPSLKEVIKPSFMVGRNSTAVPTLENFLERKWATKAIDDFRNGQCNMIVCSSVLEEGIDVQACNYVIAFDPLKTFNSYIQTKGRARKQDAEYIIFTPKINQMHTWDKIKQYTKVHNDIREFLCTRILNDGPKAEDIAKQFYDEIKPYRIASGAYITAISALGLLHRYCQMLPNDAYGLVLPTYEITQCPPYKCLVKLRLPLQSPLKETITSDPMKTGRVAKASAALKASIRLYEIGELNDKLEPVTKRECIAKVSEQFFPYWKKHNTDVNDRKAGFNQQRNYKKLYPEEFCNALPVEGEKCYAYEITMIPDFKKNEYSAHVHDLLQKHDTNYAILLRKPLPALAEMQMFMSQGKVRVIISRTPVTFVLPKGQLDSLIGYHTMLFRELLDLWLNRNFLVVDGRNEQNSLLIVPMLNKQINWVMVHKFQHLTEMAKPSVAERKNRIYRPEDYVGSVIGKWYTGNVRSRFVVTNVRTDLSPSSPFDTPQYRSYIHFFESRYDSAIERIFQPQQFMLEVRELTGRRNFFVNTKNKVNVNRDSAVIRLIPELCHNFEYPSDMWLKALLIPAVLQRAHYMLHAEHIRNQINIFLNLNNLTNFVNYEPAPLIIDPSLKRAIDIDGNASLENQEAKPILNPLPAKSKNEYLKLSTITDDLIWQEYLEPTDCKTRANSIYPIEVDYYYKFISGLALDMEKLCIDEENVWQESQLNMPKIKSNHEHSNNTNGHGLASITDVPMKEKRRIDILERTLGRMELKSAEQHEFLAALTTSGANDMFDMERFELLGDAFLKFSIAIYLIYKFPTWNEGYLTAVKSKIVSNRNLLYCMMEKDFAERIYGTLFRPDAEWLPPLVSLPANILALMQNEPNLLNQAEPSSLFNLHLTEDEIKSGKCAPENVVKFKNGCSSTAPLNNMFPRVDDGIQDYVYHQSFLDKTVADNLEAIIGVCVKNYGIRHSFRMLEFFNILHEKNLEQLLDRTLDSRTLRSKISQKDVNSYLINCEYLENNLGYKFRDRSYLLQALTHPSYPTNRLTGCYQELEFMGDAILDFLISCYIYERFQHLPPGKLTDLRTALVNNITLGCVCVRHRFHLFMLSENAPLADAVKSFAHFQETQNHRVTHQVRILIEEPALNSDDDDDDDNDNNVKTGDFNMAENIDVPKALGDIVEAIIAAVYLDSKDLDVTWNVIYHLLEQEINDFSYDVPIDPVRSLMENKHAQPQFSDPIVEENVVMMKCEFRCLDGTVSVNGVGSNKTQAKKAAAKHALQILARHAS